IPTWVASSLPGSGLGAKLMFPFKAWFDVLQNNLTFLPWGWGSGLIAGIALLVILAGLGRVLLKRDLLTRHAPLLIFIAVLATGFTAGPFLHLFPLGATRHSFILQVPLLCALALALQTIAIRPFAAKSVAAMVVAGSVLAAPTVFADTRNRVDYELIRSYFERWPDTRIADLPGGFTWEITYLARQDPVKLERIRWFLQFKDPQALAKFLMQSDHALLVSHRAPMTPEMRAILRSAGGMKISTLAEVEPGQGTELSGRINGGNGFFLYLVER
ncbi:MAG TPA: hypothetical protein VFJ90_15530, partial [Candidatus Didemnitutus sp.]|nr:hypothetical protein [Candidatus Didemnitutus sp.]